MNTLRLLAQAVLLLPLASFVFFGSVANLRTLSSNDDSSDSIVIEAVSPGTMGRYTESLGNNWMPSAADIPRIQEEELAAHFIIEIPSSNFPQTVQHKFSMAHIRGPPEKA